VENRQSAAIVRSTLILAQSLGSPVLAEGVENAEHLRFLQEEGCQQVQGFLYGKPQPLSELQDIVNPRMTSPSNADALKSDGAADLAA